MSFLLKISQLLCAGAGFKFRPLGSRGHMLVHHALLPSLGSSGKVVRSQASHAWLSDPNCPSIGVYDSRPCSVTRWICGLGVFSLYLVSIFYGTRNQRNLKHLLAAEFFEQSLAEAQCTRQMKSGLPWLKLRWEPTQPSLEHVPHPHPLSSRGCSWGPCSAALDYTKHIWKPLAWIVSRMSSKCKMRNFSKLKLALQHSE